MRKSEKYDFYLPSRDVDDIVDINQLSENFLKIDSELSEMIKGKGVDQTYNPNSSNPQSGKAVASATANCVKVDSESEWIFDGGDAEDNFDIEFVVDSQMSDSSNNAISNKVVKAYIDNLINNAKLDAHPIGSLYFSSVATEPDTLFGGTWERVKDKFILAAGDEYVAGSDGGEAEVKLKIEHMPKHSHQLSLDNYGDDHASAVKWETTSNAGKFAYGGDMIEPMGNDQPHNNMPPYEVYFCWKRTA